MPALALLPLRLFLGGMFLYAGIDKLIDPAFLQAAGPGSIGEQLLAFERVSPLAPLVQLVGEPLAVPIGLGIALLEIAVGLGALLGIGYRMAALAGAAVSALFFLTASWATRPIYVGADLPYLVGWITLAAAGHGGLLVLDGRLQAWALGAAPATMAPGAARSGRHPRRAGRPARGAAAQADVAADPTRRRLLELGALASITVVAAALVEALPIPRAAASTATRSGGAIGTVAGGSGSPAPAATDAPGPTEVTGAAPLASVDQVTQRGIVGFRDPSTGDPAVLMSLGDGRIVAYDAVCTHEGCTVGYDRGSGLLICPCHGAAFDPAHDAAVVGGPTNRPLPTLPIRIDEATGRIYLQA